MKMTTAQRKQKLGGYCYLYSDRVLLVMFYGTEQVIWKVKTKDGQAHLVEEPELTF